ncbi:MAG: hypothetical protein RLZZ200_71 [Pseudomonadota bacterium]|jgi:alcohol dehydrogenase (cytochrome c)
MNSFSRKSLTLFLLALSGASAAGFAQADGLPPGKLLAPLSDSWPGYGGDYTGRRYSALKQVDRSNVKQLTLAWTLRLNERVRDGKPRGFQLTPAAELVTQVGGEGAGGFPIPPAAVKGSILQVDGVMYVTAPDHAWAYDARDGRELWHFYWKTRGGTHIANRGAALWNDSVLFETPDNYLVSLDRSTGKEKWHVQIAPLEQEYFSTTAPVIVGNRVLVGTGNDTDEPGFLQAFDAETGKLLWKRYMVPMEKGDPALKTWPTLDAARHGGGQVWMPGVYDPETDLYFVGTGNPTPGYTGVARLGDNLYTCSVVAVRVATGEIVWHYQTSPHDTHDWDSAQTPVLVDGTIDGKPRKLIVTAARNGYFFTLDRNTGERIVSAKFGRTVNWTKGLRKNGAPDPDSSKEATVPGSLVSPWEGGVTNWPSPAFNPDTGYFYIHETNGFNLLYLTDPDPRGSMGLGGKRFYIVGFDGNAFKAIDYRTGKAAWRREWSGGGGSGSGVLTTAGGLVFTGDGSGNLVALDAANGDLLWHTRIGQISNAPQTWRLDDRQYVVVAVESTIYAFALY